MSFYSLHGWVLYLRIGERRVVIGRGGRWRFGSGVESIGRSDFRGISLPRFRFRASTSPPPLPGRPWIMTRPQGLALKRKFLREKIEDVK